MICPQCNKQHSRKRYKYCSTECAGEAKRQQLTEYTERRRQANKRQVVCIVCKKVFVQSGPQKYCSKACSTVGLLQSIERQRERRKAQKLSKES